jgi:hypothetical protein
MTGSRNRYWLAGFVLLLALVCLVPCLLEGLSPYDEGFMVEGAVRTAHGAVPYRDFFAIYAPGGFYTLAGIFRLFGSSILVERVWRALVRLAVCLVVLAIGRRLFSRTAGYLCCLLTALVLQTCGTFGFVPEALFWSLLGVLLLLRSFSENGLGWVFLGGVATGVAILYRHDMGVYALLSATVAVLLSSALDRPSTGQGRTELIQRLKALLIYGSGACVVVLPALLCLVRAVPLGDLRADILEFPRIEVQFRSLPLPPILPKLFFFTRNHGAFYDWFLFYAPLVVYLISWTGLSRLLWNSGAAVKSGGERFGWVLLTLLGSAFVMPAVIRPGRDHFLAMTVPATMLVPLLLDKWQTENWPAWSTRLVRVFLLLLTVAYTGAQIGLSRYLVAPLARHATEKASFLPRARGFYLDHDLEDAVRYVQQNVPERGAIFVGNAQHHQVFNNDAIFYFLAERSPGTRFHDFIPGVITTAAVQREVARDLERNQVNYIVLCSNPGLAKVESETPPDSGVALLDDFLRREYKAVRTFGYYSVWKKD